MEKKRIEHCGKLHGWRLLNKRCNPAAIQVKPVKEIKERVAGENETKLGKHLEDKFVVATTHQLNKLFYFDTIVKGKRVANKVRYTRTARDVSY